MILFFLLIVIMRGRGVIYSLILAPFYFLGFLDLYLKGLRHSEQVYFTFIYFFQLLSFLDEDLAFI